MDTSASRCVQKKSDRSTHAPSRSAGWFKNGSRRREEADFWSEKRFRLVTSAATPLATVLERTLQGRKGFFFCEGEVLEFML